MKKLSQKAIFVFLAITLGFSINLQAGLPGAGETLLELRKSEFSSVAVSPSGKYISTIIRRDDRNTLVILDSATMQPIPGKSVRYDKKDNMEVIGGQWLSGDIFYYSVYLEDDNYAPGYGGDIFLLYMDKPVNERVWSYHGNYLKGSRGTKIYGSLNIISTLPDDDENILVSVIPYKRRDGGTRPVIYKMKLKTGNFKKVTVGPARQAQIMSNRDGSMLAAAAATPGQGIKFYLFDRSQKNSEWTTIGIDFPGRFVPMRITNDGKYAYGLTQLDKDLNASQHLLKVSLKTGEYESFFDFGFVSQINVRFDRDSGHPIFASWVDDQPRVKTFTNHQAAKVYAGFAKSFPGYLVSLQSADDSFENMTVHVGSPGIRGEYYIWEKDAGGARYLFSAQEKIDQLGLNSYESVKYTTDDGVTLQGWLLMPRSGKPKALINYIHGGPHGPYNQFRFQNEIQIMSEMGYAVFAPNFRGSGGYGSNLERSGYKKWGTRMLDDMRQGAEFVQANYDVGDRIYTMGGSYGGYASTQNMVRHNDYYDCSVIIAGVFDMEHQIKNWDYGRAYNSKDYEITAMGDNVEQLRSQSPLWNIDKIRSPLLIIHGKADRRTPYSGAKEFVKALKKSDVDYTSYFYDFEGHGLYFEDNNLDQYEKVNKFLGRCDARAPLNPKVASR